MTQNKELLSLNRFSGLGLQSTPDLPGQGHEGFSAFGQWRYQPCLVYRRHQTTGHGHQRGESGTKVNS